MDETGMAAEDATPPGTADPKPGGTATASVDAGWPALEARLLAVGGDRVVPMPELHIAILLARGRVFAGRRARKVWGWENECHGNSVVHYLDSRGRLEIATGYGLSGDGLWRQHSWLWDGERVLETTVKRRTYYGVVLTPVEAAGFVLCEVPGLAPGMEELLKAARRPRGRVPTVRAEASSRSGRGRRSAC